MFVSQQKLFVNLVVVLNEELNLFSGDFGSIGKIGKLSLFFRNVFRLEVCLSFLRSTVQTVCSHP